MKLIWPPPWALRCPLRKSRNPPRRLQSMQSWKTTVVWISLTACFFAGCSSPKAGSHFSRGTELSIRNNCFSLLHQLLLDEKNVNLLRFIKHEESDVKTLVKRIATTSGTGAQLLEEFAKKDPSLRLDQPGLPPGETATRDAIAATKQKQLLGQTGDEFEQSLLLTQAEALSYAWHLAKIASDNDAQPDRARALSGLSEDMRKLHQEVILLLGSKTR